MVGCLLFRRDHFSLHVTEGASDKTDAFTLRVRVTALAAENPNHDTSSAPFTDFTHSGFSLSQFDAEQYVSHLIQII